MEKRINLSTLEELVLKERSTNNKIIFACGCFDIFHIGHLDYLSGAKNLGGKLFVGVNSDESISRIKKKQPIFNSSQRISIISALTCVDYVFLFEEDTFNDCLKKHKPNIFAKGVDCKFKHFPERTICLDHNINIAYIGDYKKSSSSQLSNNLNLFEDING